MQKKTKYIFMSSGYRGGATTFINDHLDYLAKRKKKLVLIDDNPYKTYEKLSKNININKVNVNKSSLDSKKNIEKILYRNNEKKILFITNYAFLIKYYSVLKNFRNKKNKIILTIHSGILNLNLKTYIAGLFFSFIYKNVDFLFFGSNTAKDWWMEYYPWMKIKNCPVHYNGVQILKSSKTKKLGKLINISFVGRLEKEHNPEFFIKIANEFLNNNHNVVFNIFGDGSLFEVLKKKTDSKNIIFHGWVKKKKIFQSSDVILITSPVNNFPYAALEAKSYGVPVISCSKGEIKKIIKNGIDGLINYTNSSKDMIDSINLIIKKYDYFSKNSIKRSKKFDKISSCKTFWKSIK